MSNKSNLNSIEKAELLRIMARQDERIRKLEAMLQGQPISTVRIADAAITNAKIDSLEWDKAQGGTAKLGGVANGNGVLEVYDGSGVLKGIWDKDGIEIRSGKITVYNDGDVATIDEKGIISTANFTKSSATKSAGLNQVINSSSYVDLTDATFTFSLARNTVVLVLSQVTHYGQRRTGSGDWSVQYQINNIIDGSEDGNAQAQGEATFVGGDEAGSIHVTTSMFHSLLTLGNGSHTIKMACKNTANVDGQSVIYSYKFTYLVLGT